MSEFSPLRRWNIIKEVLEGELTLKAASLQLGISYRQALRLKQAALNDGVRGLIHGNTGRRPAIAIDDGVKAEIRGMLRNGYGGYSDACFAKIVLKEKGIEVSRETVRKIRRSGGIRSGKGRRQPRQTASSGRPQEGRNIFWDCMQRRWFESEPYACCLVAVIDDASGRCLMARFFPFEESLVYLLALQTVVLQYGVPARVIQDCNPLLLRDDSELSIEEQLRGVQEHTQVGCALRDLGIEPVFVRTKRQQRCFERIFELFHGSLSDKLRQQCVSNPDLGNTFLEEHFIPDFNRTYAVRPEAAASGWRSAPALKELKRICAFRYSGRLSATGTVCIGDVSIRVQDIHRAAAHAVGHVDVRQLLDGSWRVYTGEKVIGKHAPTPLREPVRVKVRPQRNTTRAIRSAWMYPDGAG
jgi:transposase